MIRNAHWYSQNAGRPYPISDTADSRSTNGVLLPSNLLVDAAIRYPEDIDGTPFLAGVQVSANLVSLVFQVTGSDFRPFAVVSVPGPVPVGRPVPLQPQLPGVAGWVVFGSGVNEPEPLSLRFAGPDNAGLCPRACRPYPVAGVSGLHATNQPGLQGVVRFRGQLPLEVVGGQRTIGGITRPVAVVRMVEPSTPQGFTGEGMTSVFAEYAGHCLGRPESRTCGDPEPIESINTVTPDCSGNITINFEGCSVISQVDEDCGALLECHVNLTEACLPDSLPGEDGRLPNEYDADCVYDAPGQSHNSDSDSSDTLLMGMGMGMGMSLMTTEPAADIDEHIEIIGNLPYETDFADRGDWETVSGRFSGAGELVSESTAQRNIAIWRGFDDQTTQRKVTAIFRLLHQPGGYRHNAGLVLNRRAHPTVPGAFVYYLVDLDQDQAAVRIRKWNGAEMVSLTSAIPVIGVLRNKRYGLEASVDVSEVPSQVRLTARVYSVDDSSLDQAIGPFLLGGYYPDNGDMGLHADRAITAFEHFEVAEL